VPRAERHVHAVPANGAMRLARAVELFNASDQPRRVAGIARSLGPPLVTLRPLAAEPSLVAVVVAWELSWYRYEIDLAEEWVRIVDQGTYLEELSAEDRRANAVADERGELTVAGH
jgi:hypothetical protein